MYTRMTAKSSAVLVLLTTFIASVAAFYSASGDVVVLDTSNFKSKVTKGVWMVEFYAE